MAKKISTLRLVSDLQNLKKEASTNNTARDRLVSVFGELINDIKFNGSPIEKFNTLDAGTRNMIYHNKKLMEKVLGNMFKIGNNGDKQEHPQEINKFLKNLQYDLEKTEYNLINYPENDEVLDEIIKEFKDNQDNLTKETKELLEKTKKLIEYQKVQRELKRNNLYYRKPENTTKQQQKEKKSQTPTLDGFIESANNKEDIGQVDELIDSIKFENFGDLRSVADKYFDKRQEIIKEENIKKDEFIVSYMNSLTTKDLERFINNTVVGDNEELTEKQFQFFEFINLQTDKISETVRQQLVVSLIENPKVYNIIKDDIYPNILSLIEKYRDGKLVNYKNRTVLEEMALSGNKDSITKLEEKIKNGEELSGSMKQMLILYSGKQGYTSKISKDKREYKKKLDTQEKAIKKAIKEDEKEIKIIDTDIKELEKKIAKNEELLKKKQNELYKNYDKNKASFFDKRSFEEKREKLREEINILKIEIEQDKKNISAQQQRKNVLQTNTVGQKNRIQQINKYRDKNNRGGLEGLYKLNSEIENFKQLAQGKTISDIIEMLNASDDKDLINIAILNSYCKNADKLENEDFKELLKYCIEIDNSLKTEEGIKEPLDVLLEKDSLEKFSDGRVYDLLHNKQLEGKTQNILNNLPDNKLSALISKAVEQIEDNTEIEDVEKNELMEAEKERNKKIINTLNDVTKINTLQKDGKFETINTLIDYAKTGFTKKYPENSDSDKINIMNNIVSGLGVETIDKTKTQEEIDKQKEINKQTIQTLRNIYDIYRDNEQIKEQNKIIEKFTNSVKDLVDTPELLSEVIDFADSLYDEEKEDKKEEEKDGKKAKQTRKQRKTEINKEIIDKTVISIATGEITSKDLQDVQDKIKLLTKIAKNNRDLVGSIQDGIKEPINKLIKNKKIDIVLKIASESGNLIECLDNETVNGIYNEIKDRKFRLNGLNNRYLADTLIQIYNSYENKDNKKTEKDYIVNEISSLKPKGIISYIQNNTICDDLLLKLIKETPNLLDKIEVDERNNKIVEQIDKILKNEDSLKENNDLKKILENFKNNYTGKQDKQKKEEEKEKEKEKEKKSSQVKIEKENKEEKEDNKQKQQNVFSAFCKNPQQFMEECTENPMKLVELMMFMNSFQNYQGETIDLEKMAEYYKEPEKFMKEFMENPMKFAGSFQQKPGVLQQCFQNYTNTIGSFPAALTNMLCGQALPLQQQCAIMSYPAMGIPYPMVSYPGNIVLPSTLLSATVTQMRYEQECLSELRKQNKIAKEKLELKRQEVEELKRSNDIKESKQIMKFFSTTKIDGEDIEKEGGKIEITYSGPKGDTKKLLLLP